MLSIPLTTPVSEGLYETATVSKSIQTTSAYSRQLVGGEARLCALFLADWQYDCVGELQRNYGTRSE